MAEIQQPTVVMDGDWLALDFENYEGRECIKEHMLLNSDKKEDLARCVSMHKRCPSPGLPLPACRESDLTDLRYVCPVAPDGPKPSFN